jgi:hypothetical protein
LSRRVYLVLFVVLLAVLATGVYLRQRARAAANCETPARPTSATPPPKLPGFAVEPACGTGEERK